MAVALTFCSFAEASRYGFDGAYWVACRFSKAARGIAVALGFGSFAEASRYGFGFDYACWW